MYVKETSVEAIVAEAGAMELDERDGLLLLIAETDAPDLGELVAALNSTGIAFGGALFPAVLAGGERHDRGAVLLSLPLLSPPILLHGLDGAVPTVPNFVDLVDGLAQARATLITSVDGLAPNIRGLLTKLYGQLGNAVSYLGGGAGSLSFQQRPCLFAAEGVAQNAALLMLTSLHAQLGVRHGWERLAGPFAVTRADRNRIIELNWRPAFEVYREQVEKDAGKSFEGQDFFALAKGYPFGLLKEGQEDVVRDPVSRSPEGALVCVGDVPENAVLSILRGSPNSLLEAAQAAASEAIPKEPASVRSCVLMDCVSRAIFLEGDFDKELRAIDRSLERGGMRLHPEGALTLGEVASAGNGYLEFFNKTAVLGTLYAREI